jgi:hypothetical protein
MREAQATCTGSRGYKAVDPGSPDKPQDAALDIFFQKGPVAEVGPNGVTEEAMLAVVIDRLRSFQRGSDGNRASALALTKLEEGLHWLQQRELEARRAVAVAAAESAEPSV